MLMSLIFLQGTFSIEKKKKLEQQQQQQRKQNGAGEENPLCFFQMTVDWFSMKMMLIAGYWPKMNFFLMN